MTNITWPISKLELWRMEDSYSILYDWLSWKCPFRRPCCPFWHLQAWQPSLLPAQAAVTFQPKGQNEKDVLFRVWPVWTRHLNLRSHLSYSSHLRTDQNLVTMVLMLDCACVRVCVTCLIRGPTITAHTAVLLLGRQGFQDNVGGSEARQCDVTQVGERVFFRKQLAGFPPLAQESAFRK